MFPFLDLSQSLKPVFSWTLFPLTKSFGNRGKKIYCTNKPKFRSVSPSLLAFVQDRIQSHNSVWYTFFSQFLWTKAPWNFPWNDTFHLLPCPLFFTLAQLTAFKIYASLINFRNFVLGTLSYKITFSQGERENAISTESFLGRDC